MHITLKPISTVCKGCCSLGGLNKPVKNFLQTSGPSGLFHQQVAMSGNVFSSHNTLMYYIPAAIYISIEICFAFIFFKYMIPRANKLTPPIDYRDYGQNKLKLMLRIMHRIEEMCSITKTNQKIHMRRFLSEWFHVVGRKQHKINHNFHKQKEEEEKQKLTRTTTTTTTSTDAPEIAFTPSSSPDNSDDDSSESPLETISTTTNDEKEEMELYREEMDDFFAWAFYGKFYKSLKAAELEELDRIYKELKDRHDLVFSCREANAEKQEEQMNICQPRCMTLEPVNTMYRPLLVYLIVYTMKMGAGMLLRLKGFRRIVTSTGLVTWYRPAKNNNSTKATSSSFMPMLFFHGIAPGGFTLYLPMLLFGFATEPDRPVFIFENKSISCAIDFYPLSEQQTVDGVVEALTMFHMDKTNLSLVGHSFGSCLITWILASKRLPNIKQVVLIDPVAVLLSEPDVMVNFLYAEELDRIRMVASSELFTEYYLRRHFAWYNSELWLEDVDCPMLIGLAENDEIINSRKVKQEIERHAKSAKLVFWEGVGHGACIQSPTKWKQMKKYMLEQELQIIRQSQQ